MLFRRRMHRFLAITWAFLILLNAWNLGQAYAEHQDGFLILDIILVPFGLFWLNHYLTALYVKTKDDHKKT